MKRYVHADSDVYELANSKDKHVRQEVAENPSTPAEILAQLATDEDATVRWEVAENPSTPAEVLVQLADDESISVRWVVANNPSTSAEALTQLAKDTDARVRLEVAENPSTPPEVLVQLANDEDNDVRWRVADNPLTPTEILAQLAKDADKDIREVAQKKLNIGPKESRSTRWASIISQLDSDAESGDPFYEQTVAAVYVQSLQEEVEDALGIWLEPSIQSGQGGIWIYENGTDEILAENIDYESFNSDVLSLALESESAEQFRKAYKTYLANLIN